MRYIVKRYYKAGSVEYQAGQVIAIDDPVYAAWLARDMGGYLETVNAAEAPAAIPPVIEQMASAAVTAPRAAPKARKARKTQGT